MVEFFTSHVAQFQQLADAAYKFAAVAGLLWTAFQEFRHQNQKKVDKQA